jgi:hypothetical protein
MLERQRFLIRRRASGFDIADADTLQTVGVADEAPGRARALLRRLFGRRLVPAPLEVCELPDRSLVFEVRPAGPFSHGRVEVRDAQGQPVGSLRGQLGVGGGLRAYDRFNREFVAVTADPDGGFRFVTPAGPEVGRVTADGALLIGEELAEHPPAKMMLLAAALVIAGGGR